MVKVYRISVLKGSQFKTSNPETVAKYQRREIKSSATPIRVTRVHKKRYF